MKTLCKLFGILVLFLSVQVQAQTVGYKVSVSTDNGNPGGLNTETDNSTSGWTAITSGSQSANNWSTSQSIPFTFKYFGQTVSNFSVTQNGLLSFNNTFIYPASENEDLPTSSIQNKTVACFWDAFTASPPTGSNDIVYTKTFGSSPNRQLWVKWHSFEYGDPASSYNYFACVLEETTNKIYIVDMNYSSTNVTATVGLQYNDSIAIQYLNDAIAFGSGGSGNSDNDYYTFTPTLETSFVNPLVSYKVSHVEDSGNPGGLNTLTDVSTSGWDRH